MDPSVYRVWSYLKGAEFPARKSDLINYAVDIGADPMVVQTLNYLPRGIYRSLDQVTETLAEME